MHYLDQGTGDPAIVLLHAFPLRAAMWEPQMVALAAGARVVAPDLAGFGGSDAPEDPAAYSVDGWADDVAGLLEHLGLDRVVLGGISMGGYVAFAFLRRHRERLAGLVLADTRPGPDTPEVLERRTAQQRQVREVGTAEVIETMLEGLLSEHTRERRPEVVSASRRLMDNPPAGFIGALEAMKRRPDSTAELATIDVPSLVIAGEADRPSPPDVAREMAAAIPGSALAILPRAGHLSNLEAPEEFNRALEALMGRLKT